MKNNSTNYQSKLKELTVLRQKLALEKEELEENSTKKVDVADLKSLNTRPEDFFSTSYTTAFTSSPQLMLDEARANAHATAEKNLWIVAAGDRTFTKHIDEIILGTPNPSEKAVALLYYGVNSDRYKTLFKEKVFTDRFVPIPSHPGIYLAKGLYNRRLFASFFDTGEGTGKSWQMILQEGKIDELGKLQRQNEAFTIMEGFAAYIGANHNVLCLASFGGTATAYAFFIAANGMLGISAQTIDYLWIDAPASAFVEFRVRRKHMLTVANFSYIFPTYKMKLLTSGKQLTTEIYLARNRHRDQMYDYRDEQGIEQENRVSAMDTNISPIDHSQHRRSIGQLHSHDFPREVLLDILKVEPNAALPANFAKTVVNDFISYYLKKPLELKPELLALIHEIKISILIREEKFAGADIQNLSQLIHREFASIGIHADIMITPYWNYNVKDHANPSIGKSLAHSEFSRVHIEICIPPDLEKVLRHSFEGPQIRQKGKYLDIVKKKRAVNTQSADFNSVQESVKREIVDHSKFISYLHVLEKLGEHSNDPLYRDISRAMHFYRINDISGQREV